MFTVIIIKSIFLDKKKEKNISNIKLKTEFSWF